MEEKYRKLYESAQSAIVALQEELLAVQKDRARLEAERRQWETQKLIQQSMIQKSLNDSNATSNQYLEEIKRLKEEIRQLKDRDNGNIDRLAE